MEERKPNKTFYWQCKKEFLLSLILKVGSEQKAVGPLQKLQGHLPPTMVTRRDKYLLKREVLVSDNSCQVSNENNSLCRTFFLSALIKEVATSIIE